MQAPGLFDIPDKRGKYGLVHNVGLGGAVVVSLLRRPEFFKPGGADGRTRCVFRHLALCSRLMQKSQGGVQPCPRVSSCYYGRCTEGEIEEIFTLRSAACKPLTSFNRRLCPCIILCSFANIYMYVLYRPKGFH